MSDALFFGFLPYLALAALVGVPLAQAFSPLLRRAAPYSFVSRRRLGFAGMGLAVGLVAVSAGHLFALLFPKAILALAPSPVLLLGLEALALVAGLLLAFGVLRLAGVAALEPRVRAIAPIADRVLVVLLVAQALSGVWIALAHRWGSAWGAAVLVPYVHSVLMAAPDPSLPAAMPFAVQVHVVAGWLVLGVLPFGSFSPARFVGRAAARLRRARSR